MTVRHHYHNRPGRIVCDDVMADRQTQPAGMAFLDLRPLLLSIAYRMLGSYSDAEDIVQEAFLGCTGQRLGTATSST